ncbi:MAG: hypothetical protein PHZ26_04145 [Candidatus Gracilibacteria bacterium]|nr:hypothetical protein [Candidatus Gracilibacteria bacterium]
MLGNINDNGILRIISQIAVGCSIENSLSKEDINKGNFALERTSIGKNLVLNIIK